MTNYDAGFSPEMHYTATFRPIFHADWLTRLGENKSISNILGLCTLRKVCISFEHYNKNLIALGQGDLFDLIIQVIIDTSSYAGTVR